MLKIQQRVKRTRNEVKSTQIRLKSLSFKSLVWYSMENVLKQTQVESTNSLEINNIWGN